MSYLMEFEQAIDQQIEKLAREGGERVALRQLAYILQSRLARRPSSEKFPYASPSELLMRVVIATLEEHDTGNYIPGKLERAFYGLTNELKERSSQFRDYLKNGGREIIPKLYPSKDYVLYEP